MLIEEITNYTGHNTTLNPGDKKVLIKYALQHYANGKPNSVLREVIEQIRQDCGDYLAIFRSTDRYLYRGTRVVGDIYVGRSRLDRGTKDSDPKFSDMIDQELEARGFAARRSNSIFAMSASILTGLYGVAHVIIPKNTAQYTWSLTAGDMVFDVTDPVWNRSLISKSGNERPQSIDDVDIKKTVDRLAYTDEDLDQALSKRHEVMIHGEYYAVLKGSTGFEDIMQRIMR